MEIEFELKNNKCIDIIAVQEGKRKLVGTIFTPAGSGHYIKNAIQICGTIAAYDYWGCALFAKPNDKKAVVNRLTSKGDDPYIQMRDIQLKFDFDTEPHYTKHSRINGSDCLGCYNEPCTCDNKKWNFTKNEILEGKGKTGKNPYELKRANDLDLEEVKK